MNRFLGCIGLILLLAVSFGTVYAQSGNPVKFGIRLDPDRITYRVYMTSTSAVSGNLAKVMSAQVTIRIEDPSLTSVFTFSNLTGATHNGQQMVWSSLNGQVENPSRNGSQLPHDYISFGNSAQTSPALFDIQANTEIALFSFQRTSPCAGAVSIFVNTGTENPAQAAPNNVADPFNSPNELRTTPGNAISILGFGINNVYGGNLSNFVSCQSGTPDLSLSITGPTTLTAGVTSTYSLDIFNGGGAATTGTISLTTLLPQGLAYSGSIGAGWTCNSTTLSNGNVQVACSGNPTILASGTNSLSLNLTAASSLASATFSALVLGGGETNTANNTASRAVNVVAGPAADLTFSLIGSSNLTAGVASSFTAQVTNSGAAASSGAISTTVLLPNGFSYAGGAAAGWSVVSTTLGNGNIQIVGNNSASIGVGASSAFTFLATPPNSAGSGTFGGVVIGGGETNTANNTFSFPFTISAGGGGTVSLATSISGPASVAAGAGGAYLINVSNTGSAATSGPVTVTFTIPAGMSYNGFSGTGWGVSSAVVNGQTVYTASLSGGIGAGASAAGLTVNLLANAGASGSVNFAGAANTAGQVGSTNTFTRAITITSSLSNSDLSSSLSGPGVMQAGGSASYLLTLTNNNNTPTNGPISTTFTLPAGVSMASYAGTGWNVTSSVVNGVTVYTAVLSSVISGSSASAPLQLNLTSALNASSGNVSGFTIWSGDPNQGNNGFTFPLNVQSGTPSFTTQFTGPSNITVGTTSTITLSLTNTGSGMTTGPSMLTMNLPAGTQFNSFTAPAGWTINSVVLPNGSTSISATYTNTIPAGGSPSPFTISFTPISNTLAGSPIIITGGVSAPNSSGSSSFSQQFQVVNGQSYPADLSGSLTGPGTLTAGTSGNFTLNINNTGLGSTTGPITATMSLPAGSSMPSFTGAGWSVSSTAGAGGSTILTATYTAAVVSGGSPTPLVFNVLAGVTLAGTTLNLSGRLSTLDEVNTVNNQFSTSSQVVSGSAGGQSANLSTTIQMTNTAPNQYEPTTARIVITNSGPNTATGITSQVGLPAGNPITSLTTSGGSFNSGTGLWTVGALTPGQSVTLTVTFSAATGGVATVSNEIISSSLPDPNSTPNNRAAAEDDQKQVCFSVPLTLCAGQQFMASVSGATTGIQWSRNGQPIQGATSSQLLITQSGTYTVQTGTPCEGGGCCPLIVRDGDCCQLPVCVPITISRNR
ncbi:MAG: DUF11 domain-containing protein [Cytophagales bacterium]|nr:MAG: DUF11 domain-containing protein [Cytophagales bacterium]